ncbi:MAG: isoleucine--tRNA ligase [Bdellovibrionales bacterium]|nr:isoleucine--tRNA ligase [Bdellovibrionales bacterium]
MEKKHKLQLPKTDFPMKAKLPEKEPKLIEFWQTENIYQKCLNKGKNKKFFSFVDGPPYANGNLHVGHALNKILKDIVVKYSNLSGKYCPFIPVWDCHGLPIELAALKKIKKEKKSSPSSPSPTASLSPAQIREHCRKEARFWIDKQKRQFKRLGVLADWNQALLTMSAEYEAQEVRALAQIARKNLLYRGKKPVHWCPALQTAIASSEVEYHEHKSPSIYVKFPFFELPKQGKLSLPPHKPCSFVIWTTTPWTLPANLAICLKASFTYAVFDTGKEFFIIAEDLQENFEKKTGLKLKKIFSFKGKEWEHKKARHPFMDRDSLIVLGDHVTKEEGTGCVHTAPGHGLDDFIVGKKYKLPVFVPVDEKGCFTSEVPQWEGLFIFKANPLIIEKLRQNSCLVAEKEIVHNYPFNPRSSTPLIFRATDQWFIKFDNPEYSIRKKSLSEINNNIQFYPEWGKQRLSAMIKSSPDWCLSRQRNWGVPIPVFYCRQCQHTLMSADIMEEIADQMEKSEKGIEYWFLNSAKNLLSKNRVCPKCQNTEFEKSTDILDVWFDSGICHDIFKKKYGTQTFPADLYLEGSDQHRGWFQTSLNSSICINDKSPFKSLITHGYVNDAEGYKMSKSKGNVVNLESLIQNRGAEIVRLWVCSEDYSQDSQFTGEIFERISESYRRFRNTIRFMLGNLFDFAPEKDVVSFSQMKKIDQWILGRLKDLVDKTQTHYEGFVFHKIYQDLNVFFTKDLSSLYLDLLKDRLYTFKKEGRERRSAQSAIYLLLKNLLSLMSPIMTFLSEEAYRYLPGEKEESILLTSFPSLPSEWHQPKIREYFNTWLKLREEVYSQIEPRRKAKEIGSSLETRVILSVPKNFLTSVEGRAEKDILDDLRELFIVSQVELQSGEEGYGKVEVQKAKGEKCDRCWNYSEELNNQKICLKCISNLS